MKNFMTVLALIFVASPAFAVVANRAVSGSSDEAVQVAEAWLHKQYKAPNEPVTRMKILPSSDNGLMIQAKIRNQLCTLHMKKEGSENNVTWTVDQHQCAEEIPGR